jgi:hypothetical protein
MRVYTKTCELILSNKDLLLERDEIKQKNSSQDQRIGIVFDQVYNSRGGKGPHSKDGI